jgi:hypothetical protein
MQGFDGKTRRKEPLGKPRRRWVYNIKLDIQEMGYGGMDWIDLAQDRDRLRALMNAVVNVRVFIKCGEFHDKLKTG